MNDTTRKPNDEDVNTKKETDSAFASEMEELKRDMRSAQLVDWIQTHQQQLIAAAVAIVLILVGGSLWLERNKSQKNEAAKLYHQALSISDSKQKQAMLEKVINEYHGTAYSSLAHLHLSKLSDQPEVHLNALINDAASTPELAWQASLDLAQWYLSQGRADEARGVLKNKTGKQYEQLRHYLLAEASTDKEEKKKHLQMSLDSETSDVRLKARVERMLSELNTGT